MESSSLSKALPTISPTNATVGRRPMINRQRPRATLQGQDVVDLCRADNVHSTVRQQRSTAGSLRGSVTGLVSAVALRALRFRRELESGPSMVPRAAHPNSIFAPLHAKRSNSAGLTPRASSNGTVSPNILLRSCSSFVSSDSYCGFAPFSDLDLRFLLIYSRDQFQTIRNLASASLNREDSQISQPVACRPSVQLLRLRCTVWSWSTFSTGSKRF